MASKRPLPAYQISNVRLLDELTPATNQTVKIDLIQLPIKQPRRYFDPQKMQQLVQSIQEHGILEPLLVRPLANGQYELIAGERRFRAAQILGLDTVPIISKDVTDKEAIQIALVENLQREDLNPVEETEAILELLSLSLDIEISDITSTLNQSANAKKRGLELTDNVTRQLGAIESLLANVGRFNAESFRTNRLPLLNMPDDVLETLRQGKLEFTKARAIARIRDEAQRQELLEESIAQNLSLSQIKARIAAINSVKNTIATEPSLKDLMSEAFTTMKKSKVWDNPKKTKKLAKLLAEIETLIQDE
ncbi:MULTISPECIES: ParB/RepB/Spo0J family partition protein [Pseudanabaena]|jgi:ParB family transcriptional regulator, chromosome partitioning protein|uniref:ParB/RepB/Spo0J family partition protein n=1 Tax=Pseudanabaena TaxID=1152 RepID=UPI002478AF0C|nr:MULTISPECIES: ParB/RepB/Spo0J family partition protein [Pseudanabaena]MEA5489608.1 ParB/RepB/Spo0J family partition protein [Pseudanabaena sp. CCNP1317]WGS74730.1 ParB/RepB/Spo0J family partition protein [Pseudanabaena galeata CCNP1313]